MLSAAEEFSDLISVLGSNFTLIVTGPDDECSRFGAGDKVSEGCVVVRPLEEAIPVRDSGGCNDPI